MNYLELERELLGDALEQGDTEGARLIRRRIAGIEAEGADVYLDRIITVIEAKAPNEDQN